MIASPRRSPPSIPGSTRLRLLLGATLCLLTLLLALWNEARAVRDFTRRNALHLQAISANPDTLAANHRGRPLHMIAPALTSENLTDPLFNLSANAIALHRNVEIYRPVDEASKKTYAWSSPSHPESPPPSHDPFPYDDWSATVSRVTFGAFILSPELMREMHFSEPHLPRQASLPDSARNTGEAIYFGDNPEDPQPGDHRITFEVVPQDTLTVLARQEGSTLVPWRDSLGRSVKVVRRGEHSLEDILADFPVQPPRIARGVRLLTALLFFGSFLLLGSAGLRTPGIARRLGRLPGGNLPAAAALYAFSLTALSHAAFHLLLFPSRSLGLILLALAFPALHLHRILKPIRPTPSSP